MRLENVTSTLIGSNNTRNLGISIKGLALSHFDRQTDQWKIFFPKALDHDFTMIVRKSENGEFREETRYQLTATRKIEIITNQTTGASVFNPLAIESIPDLSALHGEELHLINDRNRYSGFLILNQTTLTTERQNEPREFEIWKVETSSTMTRRRYIDTKDLGVASDAGADFAPGSLTEIKIEGEFILELVHDENINYEVIFDNDCHRGMSVRCSESDFKFYYDIIDETKLQTKCRFDLVFIPPSDSFRGEQGDVCGKGRASDLIIPEGLY